MGWVRGWAAGLAVLALVGCRGSGGGGGPAAGGQPGAAQATPVEVLALEPGPVSDSGEYVGTLISRQSVALYPQVAGYVQEIAVRPGDRVEAGQVLLVVDPRRERAELRATQAQRGATLAQRENARRTLARTGQLFRAGAVSRQEYDQAQAQAESAEANARAIEAQIQSQQVQLGYYRVSAPFAGVVGDIPVKQGDYVTPQTELTRVDQAGALEVSVAVPVERARQVKVGQTRVEVLDAQGEPVASAPAFFVAATPQPTTQLVEVKAGFENEVGLRPGQLVRVRVVYDVRDALRLPTYAVTRVGTQPFALVVVASDGGTVVKRQPVKLGQVEGNAYEVLGGLDAGVQVAVSGIQRLRDGQPVQPRPAQPPGTGGGGSGDGADAGQ